MRRDTQNVILLLLGGVLLRICADDTVLRYVRPGHRWLVIGAGVVIVALAVTALIRDHLAALLGRHHAQAEAPDHEHEHGGVERHSPWLLMLPVLVLAFAAPAALGADAVERVPLPATAPATIAFEPLPAGDAPELTLMDFFSRAQAHSGDTLTGRTVTLTGFAVRTDTGVRLARITITCCAADARPTVVRLVADPSTVAGIQPNTWLRVRGTVEPGSATRDTRWIPALDVSGLQMVPAPPDPYEY